MPEQSSSPTKKDLPLTLFDAAEKVAQFAQENLGEHITNGDMAEVFFIALQRLYGTEVTFAMLRPLIPK